MTWVDRYIGIPYVAKTGDCAAFAQRVAREVLHMDVVLPGHATGLRAQALQIDALKDRYAERVDAPIDAHPVLFLARKKFYHMGAVALIAGETWVVHADQSVGMVVCQRLRDMIAWQYELEGMYRWL